MQRHRHERVGIVGQLAPGPRHPAAHGRRQIEPVAVFERMHERARDVVVAHRRAGAGEGGRMGDRLGRQHAGPRVVAERRAQPLAERRRDERQLRPARGAQAAVIADETAAGRAQRRQAEVEGEAERGAHGGDEPTQAGRAPRSCFQCGLHGPA